MTMNCEQCRNAIEDLLDSTLTAEEMLAVEAHLQHCAACRDELATAQRIRHELSRLHAPALRPDFLAETVGKARAPEPRQRKRGYGFAAGFGSAIAAGIAVWFAVMLYSPQGEEASMLQAVSMSVGRVQQVHLVFNSPEQFSQATFTLLLPENAEVEGYPGKRELTWTASLQKGRNRLTLPLRLAAVGQGELIARITHGKEQKEFHLKLEAKARNSMAGFINRV